MLNKIFRNQPQYIHFETFIPKQYAVDEFHIASEKLLSIMKSIFLMSIIVIQNYKWRHFLFPST